MGFNVDVGAVVYHKEHGRGRITKITEEKVYVNFGNKRLIFFYPKAFVQEDLILVNIIEKPLVNLEIIELPTKKSSNNNEIKTDGINEPLVSDYWFKRTRAVLEGTVKTEDYLNKSDGKHVRFRCYASRGNDRMEVWLNPPSGGESEFISIWIRDGLIPPYEVKTLKGIKKDFKRSKFTECEVRFYISKPSDKEKEMEEAFNFIREIRQLVEH